MAMLLHRSSNSNFKNWFFENQPQTDFQKTNFVFSTASSGKYEIGFIMRIADTALQFYCDRKALYDDRVILVFLATVASCQHWQLKLIL